MSATKDLRDRTHLEQFIDAAVAEARKGLPIMDQDTSNRIFEALGRIEAKQDSFKEALLGPGGRITVLEEDASWQKKEKWIHTCVIVPVIGACHAIANHFGVRF